MAAVPADEPSLTESILAQGRSQERIEGFYRVAAVLILLGGAYGTAELAIGETLLPGGELWSLVLIMTGAHIGGFAMTLMKLPPLLGMLLSGVVLVNLPGELVDGLPTEWGSRIRAGALAVILTRSGLELDLQSLKRAGGAAVRLTACPGIVEALTLGGMAVWVWDMPIMLGLTLGFILAAVSPAVVVTGMFDLQKRGYGVKKGIPSLVVAASSFDDVIAITGYSLCIGFAVPSGGSVVMEALEGPINIGAGFFVGGFAGIIVGSTALWSTPLLRTLVTLLASQLLMFTAYSLHYTGAGALASLMMGIVASKMWARTDTPSWYRGEVSREYAHAAEHDIAVFWKWIAQPLLFGIIGTAVNFNVLSPSTIPKALLVIFVGVCVRLPTATAVTWGANLNAKERFFIGGSWLAKATVQAALASSPLDIINEFKKDDADYEQYRFWGEAIVTTAVFSIITTAPIGVLFISYFGDRCLTHTNVQLHLAPTDEEKAQEEEDGDEVAKVPDEYSEPQTPTSTELTSINAGWAPASTRISNESGSPTSAARISAGANQTWASLSMQGTRSSLGRNSIGRRGSVGAALPQSADCIAS